MDAKKIGKFIALKRKKLNLTQLELADKINVTDSAVSKWERGQGCPDISLLIPLSRALGVSVNELLLGQHIDKNVPKETADELMRETINISINKMNLNIRKNRIFKISFFIFVIIGLIVGGLTYNKQYQFKKNKQNFVSLNTQITKRLRKLKFVKDGPSISPNYILHKEQQEVTYVSPVLNYGTYRKTGIYSELLSYDNYPSQQGIIVYIKDKKDIVVHYVENNNMLTLNCTSKGRLKSDVIPDKAAAEFYNDNKDRVRIRVIDAVEMWEKIYKDIKK